jgi:hypothetical protein
MLKVVKVEVFFDFFIIISCYTFKVMTVEIIYLRQNRILIESLDAEKEPFRDEKPTFRAKKPNFRGEKLTFYLKGAFSAS